MYTDPEYHKISLNFEKKTDRLCNFIVEQMPIVIRMKSKIIVKQLN